MFEYISHFGQFLMGSKAYIKTDRSQFWNSLEVQFSFGAHSLDKLFVMYKNKNNK